MKQLAFLIASIVGFLICYPAFSAEEKPEDKLTNTLKSLASTKENAAAIQAKLEKNERESKRLQQRATELADDLQQSETQVTREEARYSAVAGQLAGKQKEFDARAADYAKTVRSMLMMQTIPATAMLATPEHLPQLMQTTSALSLVNSALRERATALRSEMKALNKLKEKANLSKITLSRQQSELEQRQKALSVELTARQQLHQSLSKDHAEALTRMSELSRESQNLQELIAKLERNRDHIAIAAKSSPKPLPTSSAKGSWRLPVTGSITHRFGEKRNANESWRGMVLRARAGGSVVAPSAGEIVFTGPFRDYGRMVLIKHQDKNISLLAGLGTISVALNQQVARGEPVGTMGNTAPIELYVELRAGSKPVDPAAWYATTLTTVSTE